MERKVTLGMFPLEIDLNSNVGSPSNIVPGGIIKFPSDPTVRVHPFHISPVEDVANVDKHFRAAVRQKAQGKRLLCPNVKIHIRRHPRVILGEEAAVHCLKPRRRRVVCVRPAGMVLGDPIAVRPKGL